MKTVIGKLCLIASYVILTTCIGLENASRVGSVWTTWPSTMSASTLPVSLEWVLRDLSSEVPTDE